MDLLENNPGAGGDGKVKVVRGGGAGRGSDGPRPAMRRLRGQLGHGCLGHRRTTVHNKKFKKLISLLKRYPKNYHECLLLGRKSRCLGNGMGD